MTDEHIHNWNKTNPDGTPKAHWKCTICGKRRAKRNNSGARRFINQNQIHHRPEDFHRRRKTK